MGGRVDRPESARGARERVPVNYKGFSYLNKCTQLVSARNSLPVVVIPVEAGIQDATVPAVVLAV